MLEIWQPEIFPKNKIKSGVTKKNLKLFPKTGFCASKAQVLTDDGLSLHIQHFAKFLGTDVGNLKMQHQVHGININIITKNSPVQDADGMITSEKELILYTKIADCCGILIYDPVKEVISVLHSGWRGTQLNIASEGIKKLKEIYNCNPKDLLVYLSPCAGGDKYEVGLDVAKYFPDSTRQINNNKFLFDNKKEIYKQLIQSGVNCENIEISEVCSISNLECHSYRRDGDVSGRMAAYIGMI